MNLGSCKQKIKAEIVLPFHFRQLSSGTLSLTFFHQFFTLFRAVVVLSLRPALFNELSVRSLPALKGAARGGIGGVALTLQLEFALCHRCPCALLAAGALNMPQWYPRIYTILTPSFFLLRRIIWHWGVDLLNFCGREDNICWLSQTGKLNKSGI